MSVANQKIVQIAPRVKRDKEHLFAMINLDAASKATKNLKGSSFKLWFYIDKNQEKYQFELSQKACADWGIKKDSYYSAVNELIEQNYLVPVSDGSNYFYFYENGDGKKPKMISETPLEESKKEKGSSENKSILSEKTERNNINITYNTENKTSNNTPPSFPNQYAYLDDKIGVDGSFELPNGKLTWIDALDFDFYRRNRDDKVKNIMEYMHLTKGEAEYVVDKILFNPKKEVKE